MTITGYISRLYQQDGDFYGDCLIEPLRFSVRQWQRICSPLNPALSSCWQIAQRIASAVALIFITVVGIISGFVGGAIKAVHMRFRALSIPPTVAGPVPYARRAINPPIERFEKKESAKNEALPLLTLYPVVMNISGFLEDFRPWVASCQRIYRLTWLTPVRVSSQNMPSVALSDPNAVLLHGAMSKYPIPYPLTYVEEFTRGNPQQEIALRNKLKKQYWFNSDIDYLARLMPGGYVAFDAMPGLTIPDVSKLKPNDMPASLVRDRDEKGNIFIAMKLEVQDSGQTSQIVLVFVCTQVGAADGIGKPYYRWIQQPNEMIPKDRLRFHSDTAINMVLHLIQGEPLGEQELALWQRHTNGCLSATTPNQVSLARQVEEESVE